METLSTGPGHRLLSDEDRLALLSTLRELIVAATKLFSPERSVSDFMARLAERLGCVVVLCLEELPRGDARLTGSAGLSRRSRELPVSATDGPRDWSDPALPYPELSRPRLTRWTFPMSAGDGGETHVLLLAFDRPPLFAGHLERMVRQHLLDVLQSAIAYRRTLARLMEKSALLQYESEASADAILVVGEDGSVASVNRRFRELWRLPGLEEGTPARTWMQEAAQQVRDPIRFMAWLEKLQARPDVERRGEVVLRGGRILETITTPIRSATGVNFGRGWFFRDVTARRRAQRERVRLLAHERSARRAAEEALRERDAFLSLASHELKTPLTGLSLRLERLSRMSAGRPRELETVQRAQGALSRLTRLVNYLLDSTRVATGRLELRRRPLSLNRLVREVVSGFESADTRHPVSLQEYAMLEVLGDDQRLEQVVTNLLDNAIKYSPEGGEVRVAVREHAGQAVLTVTDHGVGIPKAQQPLLFQRFFRAENVRSGRFTGLGLGLFICRDIVERHGGRIWIDSEEGLGSTVYVALPILGSPTLAPQPAHHSG